MDLFVLREISSVATPVCNCSLQQMKLRYLLVIQSKIVKETQRNTPKCHNNVSCRLQIVVNWWVMLATYRKYIYPNFPNHKTSKSFFVGLGMSSVEDPADYQHVLIFLHGVGGSGSEWARFLRKVVPPNTKLILPSAPKATVDLFPGREMSSWYNMYSSYSSNLLEVKNMADLFHRIIQEEGEKGINSEDIVLGGFSQGESSEVITEA